MSVYYLWGIVDLIVYLIVSPELFSGKQIMYYLFGMRYYKEYYFTGALWFLPALFCAQLVFFCMIKHISSKYGRMLILVLFCDCHLLVNKFQIVLPYNIDTLPYTIVFMYFGYWIEKSQILYRELKEIYRIVLSLIFLTGLYLITKCNGATDIFSNKISNYLLYILGAVCGFCFTYFIVKVIQKMNISLLKKYLLFVGRNSLFFMLIHQQIVIHPWNCTGISFGKARYNNLFLLGLCMVATSTLVYVIDNIRKKKYS